jgi:putative copper export protein
MQFASLTKSIAVPHQIHTYTDMITAKLLVSAVVGGCSVVFVLRAIKTVKDRRDSNRIYEVLRRFAQMGSTCFGVQERFLE